MTHLFIDTEFNGFGGALMSMALVSGDGKHEWYQVLPLPALIDPWVAEHVVPLLGKEAMTPAEFRLSLKVFLEQFDQPTIYADWYTDLALFFNAFAGEDHSTSFSFPCRAVLMKDVPDIISAIPHNALADARSIRDWFMGGKP